MLLIPTVIDNWIPKVCKPFIETHVALNIKKYVRKVVWYKNGIIIYENNTSEQEWNLNEKPSIKYVRWGITEYTVGYYTDKYGKLVKIKPCPVCKCGPELRIDLATHKFYTTDTASMIPWDAEISKVDPERREEWFEDTELFKTPEAALSAWNA